MPKKTEPTLRERQQSGIMTTLMSVPGVASVAKRFADAVLTVELHAPDEETLALIAVDPQEILNEAKEFAVTTDDDYKAAKSAADALKDEADKIDGARTRSTKPLGVLKNTWDSLFNPSKKAREDAAATYHNKMRAYERKKKEEDERLRREQEEEARRSRENMEAMAAEEESRANKLKNPAKKAEALQTAQQLRAAAQQIPETFAATQISAPALGSGSKQEKWLGEILDEEEFAGWLFKQPLWRSKIVEYQQSGLNDLAKQAKDNTKIPGFKAELASSYRREAKRKAEPGEK